MIGPSDLKKLASVIDPAKESQLLRGFETEDVPTDYDVEHLDYGYVAQCSDMHELATLLRVLRSGKEGIYIDLENAIIERMEHLCPQLRRCVSGQQACAHG
nr:Sperm associated antigen 1 [Polyrhizophydium stewartii]